MNEAHKVFYDVKVAGVSFRKDYPSNLEGINKFLGALVPEPENKFDPNAIKVVAYFGHHAHDIEHLPKDFTEEDYHYNRPYVGYLPEKFIEENPDYNWPDIGYLPKAFIEENPGYNWAEASVIGQVFRNPDHPDRPGVRLTIYVSHKEII